MLILDTLSLTGSKSTVAVRAGSTCMRPTAPYLCHPHQRADRLWCTPSARTRTWLVTPRPQLAERSVDSRIPKAVRIIPLKLARLHAQNTHILVWSMARNATVVTLLVPAPLLPLEVVIRLLTGAP